MYDMMMMEIFVGIPVLAYIVLVIAGKLHWHYTRRTWLINEVDLIDRIRTRIKDRNEGLKKEINERQIEIDRYEKELAEIRLLEKTNSNQILEIEVLKIIIPLITSSTTLYKLSNKQLEALIRLCDRRSPLVDELFNTYRVIK
jgi:hypothetical protein